VKIGEVIQGSVKEGLEVKQVWVGEGETRRRFVVCRNLEEARRDMHHREQALERLEAELKAVERKQGEARVQAEAELLTHPTLRRYLTRRRGRLVIDRGKARAASATTRRSSWNCRKCTC